MRETQFNFLVLMYSEKATQPTAMSLVSVAVGIHYKIDKILLCLTKMEACNKARTTTLNLVLRASVAFPQKASRQADTPGKRRPDLDKLFGTNHLAGSVEELTFGLEEEKTEFCNVWTVR